jgi:hypothetical protein
VAGEAANLAEGHRVSRVEQPLLFVAALEIAFGHYLLATHRIEELEGQAELAELPGDPLPALHGIRQTDNENFHDDV